MDSETDRDIMASKDKLTVYFDGSCPLCRREIRFLRARTPEGDTRWCDVSACDGEAVAPDLTTQAAMQRFHVRRGDGTLISGAAAFAEMWARSPRFAWLGRLAKFPPLRIALDAAYTMFLKVRPLLQRLAGGADRPNS